MALSTNPSRVQIFSEFGLSTVETPVSEQSIKVMYEKIFNSSNHSRNEFSGYGKPDVRSASASQGNTPREVVISYTVSAVNKTYCRVVIDWSTNSSFTSGVNSTSSLTHYSEGTYGVTLTMPNYNTQYYFRVRYYNDFNDHSYDHLHYPPFPNYISHTTGDEQSLQPPSIIAVELQPRSGSTYDLKYIFNQGGTEPSGWDLEADINGGSRFPLSEIDSNTSSNPRYITGTSLNLVLSGGEEINGFLRAQATSQFNSSGWASYFFTAEALEPPINPTLAQINNDGDVQCNWSRDNLSSGTTTRVDWYVNGSFHSQDFITNGANSVIRKFSDGDSVHALVRYTQGIDQTSVQTNTVSVEIIEEFNPPRNVSISMSGNSAVLSWQPPLNAPSGVYYQAQFRVDGQSFGSPQTTSTSVSSYNVCNIGSMGTFVEGRVRAIKDGVYSDYTSWVSTSHFCPF